MSLNGKRHPVALWAGVAAFFGSLLAIGVFDLLDIRGWAHLLSALITAGITAGAVYARERLSEAKKTRPPAVASRP